MPNSKTPTYRGTLTLIFTAAIAATGCAALVACGGGSAPSDGTTASASTSTAGVLCDYSSSVFNSSPSVNATATATWSCSSTLRSLTTNGLPDHAVGTFPNVNNPNTIAARTTSVSGTLTPTATSAITAQNGPGVPMGYVLNGIKIDPSTAGTCNDAGTSCDPGRTVGTWKLEGMGGAFNFGTDANNAHVQPSGEYHYHGIPEGFVTKLNKGQAMTLIGWAADGFPIYARYGYSVATDASSAIKVVSPSYRLKAAPDANRPATTTYAMGTFTQDYEYVAGSGDLDECNGRTGVTPEFPNGIYHYYATGTFPYLQRCVKGKL
jgi:YHYH protein